MPRVSRQHEIGRRGQHLEVERAQTGDQSVPAGDNAATLLLEVRIAQFLRITVGAEAQNARLLEVLETLVT